MPKFTIRRKRKVAPKVAEPEPVEKEVKVDDEEMSVSSDEENYVTEAMKQLNVQTKPQRQQNHVRFEPNPRPQYETRARVDRQPTRNPKYITQGAGQQPRYNPMYRKTPTPFAQNQGMRGRAKPRIKFRSLYGPNGSAYDTRTKAGMLYHACFG